MWENVLNSTENERLSTGELVWVSVDSNGVVVKNYLELPGKGSNDNRHSVPGWKQISWMFFPTCLILFFTLFWLSPPCRVCHEQKEHVATTVSLRGLWQHLLMFSKEKLLLVALFFSSFHWILKSSLEVHLYCYVNLLAMPWVSVFPSSCGRTGPAGAFPNLRVKEPQCKILVDWDVCKIILLPLKFFSSMLYFIVYWVSISLEADLENRKHVSKWMRTLCFPVDTKRNTEQGRVYLRSPRKQLWRKLIPGWRARKCRGCEALQGLPLMQAPPLHTAPEPAHSTHYHGSSGFTDSYYSCKDLSVTA